MFGATGLFCVWGLHNFGRKTFATMHSEAGVSPPTIQRWLSVTPTWPRP